MIACASVVTKACLEEFELLRFSISQHHDVEWFLSTDQEAYNALSGHHNCRALIKSEGSHGSTSSDDNNNFMQIMMTKLDACQHALETHKSVLFTDSDIFFLNPIDPHVVSLIHNENVDALLCPHHTENKPNEAKVGYYNAGFFVIRNISLLNDWKNLNKKALEVGLYYDQQPLEYVSKTYTTVNLPIQYDIGWWRMNEEYTKNRMSTFQLVDDIIHFMGKPANSIHAHTFKRLDYGNHATEMLYILTQLLKNSNDKNHRNLLNKLIEMCRGWQ